MKVEGCHRCPFATLRPRKQKFGSGWGLVQSFCSPDENKRYPLAAQWKCIPPGCPLAEKGEVIVELQAKAK